MTVDGIDSRVTALQGSTMTTTNRSTRDTATDCTDHGYAADRANTTISSKGQRHKELVHRYLYRCHHGWSKQQIESITVVRTCGNIRCVQIEHMTHTGQLTEVQLTEPALTEANPGMSPVMARNIARQKQEGKTYKRLSDLYNLTIAEVKAICQSQIVQANSTGYEHCSVLSKH